MSRIGYYTNKKDSLVRKFKKLLNRYKPVLLSQYGEAFVLKVSEEANENFLELIPRIPYYETGLYKPIILLNAQLIAIVKAMKKHGKTVEDVLRIQADFLREDFGKIPNFAGKIYVSKFAGFFLEKAARQGTAEGWEAEFVQGTPSDDFDVSVVTERCGLVEYLKSEGMDDFLKYCNVSDFIMFPAMNIGLKQPSTMAKDGKCVYCMTYKGHSEIPASLDIIYTPEKA